MSVHIKHRLPDCAVARTTKARRMHLLLRWWENATRSWQKRKMIVALRALDDRILVDIGIHPGEIESFVDGLDSAEPRMTPVAAEPVTKTQDVSYADLRRAA